MARLGNKGGATFMFSTLDKGHSYAEVLLEFSVSLGNQQQVTPLLETLNYRAFDDLTMINFIR